MGKNNGQQGEKNKRLVAFAGKHEVKSVMMARQQLLVLLCKDIYSLLTTFTHLCLVVLCLYCRTLMIYFMKKFPMDYLV